MTVAVAASLTDLPLSLALFLGMDDTPDAPMRHPHPPPYTPRTTATATSHVPQMLHTLNTPTHSPRTTSDPLTQQTLPKTTFDTDISHHQPSTSFESNPVASDPLGSSWEGVSPDPAHTSSLSLYGSPSLPVPSPHTSSAPAVTTYPSHTEGISHSVSVTLAELTLASSQSVQTQSDYSSAYTEPGYGPTAIPSLALLVGDDQQCSSDWSTISGATVGLEGWGVDPQPPVWPTPVTNVTAPSDPEMTWVWPSQSAESDNLWHLQAPPVCSPPRGHAALSPASREVSLGFLHGNGAPHGRRSASRSPLSPSGAASTPSPRGDLPPRSPLALPGSPQDTRSAATDRRRWRRRQHQQQHDQQRSQQKGDEEGVWWGCGSGRRWSGQPRRSHSLVPMESAGGARPVESGAPSPSKCSPPGDHTPHAAEQHTSRDEGQDDDEDDDTEPSRVCVPPGESLQFEQFELRAQIPLCW